MDLVGDIASDAYVEHQLVLPLSQLVDFKICQMENGGATAAAPAAAYPPPLPPQAHLSAAFQAANAASATAGSTLAAAGFQEALMQRMGRPFGLTVS